MRNAALLLLAACVVNINSPHEQIYVQRECEGTWVELATPGAHELGTLAACFAPPPW